MKFASLGSGSEGNALVVQSGATTVLMDCGFSVSECLTRLNKLELTPEAIDGIVVTHEHSDHIGGVVALANKFAIPVWLTFGTLSVYQNRFSALEKVFIIDPDERFAIGDIEIHGFPVPHDAREPVQYVFSDGSLRLGVLTDIGMSTAHVESVLSGCHALVLECNHDRDMLLNGNYPPSLKKRITSNMGHLDNTQAANLLQSLDCTRLQHLIAAHLSQVNNTPELAKLALSQALCCDPDWIGIAGQADGFAWREII
jgi:phosphoribosyl 1,2-cyclic phosphodiesterase